MEWLNIPDLINAVIAVGIYAMKSELRHIKDAVDGVRSDTKKAHDRIDDLLRTK